MRPVAHLDLFCGASGDMLLGALIDAGVPLTTLESAITALGLPGLSLAARSVVKRGIAATHAEVVAPHEHAHRHLPDILRILEASDLRPAIKDTASRVFQVLAEAEARVHQIPVAEVHFHEVGALDAIADVVGVVAGFDCLGLAALSCRALPVSHGTVRCEHGLLPVPAPAVLRLMEGLPTEPLDIDGETVTPTAAALLRVLVTDWASAPPMTVSRQGYGAGTKEFPRANVLRIVVGVADGDTDESRQRLVELSTNLDDMNPEWLPPLVERLLAAGARDVWLTPILMKKGRPAHTLSVLCEPDDSAALRALVYRHSTTLGLRETTVERYSLPRRSASVTTPWGPVSVKIAHLPGGGERAAPEHEDCRRISESAGIPLTEVYDAASRAWRDTRP